MGLWSVQGEAGLEYRHHCSLVVERLQACLQKAVHTLYEPDYGVLLRHQVEVAR